MRSIGAPALVAVIDEGTAEKIGNLLGIWNARGSNVGRHAQSGDRTVKQGARERT